MKIKLLLLMAVILSLGCSALSLPFMATPIPEIIYKAPTDMNLRPGDIPGLQSTELQNPASEPLLPEATAQNQRAFEDITQDITIETDVIVVPEKTTRALDEIYNVVIPKRRPSAQKSTEETPVKIGDQGELFKISDDCGPGYILIATRNNVIFAIIGCGSEIDPSYIQQIGLLIDGYITGTVVSCSQLGLTPEECANSGSHEFSESRKQNEFCGGTSQQTGDFLIIFSQDKVYVNLSDNGWENQSDYFSKTGPNTYIQTGNTDNIAWNSYLTFNGTGFTLRETVANTDAPCDSTDTFTILK